MPAITQARTNAEIKNPSLALVPRDVANTAAQGSSDGNQLIGRVKISQRLALFGSPCDTYQNSTPQKRFKKFTCGHKQQSRELLKALGHGEFNCGHMQQSHELHKALGHGDPSECLLHSSLTPLSKVGLWVGMFNRQAMVDLQRG
eukprot:scaffold176773_cov15-Tisochrysis_lutea.AAC.1